MHVCHYCGKQGHLKIDFSNSELPIQSSTISTNLSVYNTTVNISTIHISISSLSTTATSNISITAVSNNLLNTCTIKIITAEFRDWIYSKPKFLELVKSSKSNQQQPLINNILPATISNNESLAAIFSFKLEETTPIPLFSRAALDTKPIITMYTNVKADGHIIKLILDINCAASARIITANRVTKTPISKIDNFFFEVNDITILIKVLVMEATQYQALIVRMVDTYEYQPHVHNKLPLVPTWNDQGKRKQKKELTWNSDQKKKGKVKEEEPLPTAIYTSYTYIPSQQSSYHQSKLICIDCGKKLSSIGACCGNNEEYQTATKFYCCACIIECFR
ncbi:hypothetical protein G9A89_014394 [Geosiphon pyriformis]|nr:hypothetical protein G9A89_014394 [Geosiphon pyriformis]